VTAVSYQLEHFYYGQFARDGKPEGSLRVLAASAGLKMDSAAEIARQALLPPLRGAPTAAWAVVRGRHVPFIMAQSQLGTAGQSMLHYILLPSDVLRSLGGNLDALLTLIEPQMPSYDRLGDTLPPLELAQAGPPESEQQIEHILELMTYARNQLDVIEALLAAIVQGVQVVAQGAPRDLAARTGFIKGLLALLPPPARFGVTFATHSLPSTHLDAQIRFFSDDPPPAETLVYQWGEAAVHGKTTEDSYSRYIISQLRLDAELVSQRTRQLTAVAAWRIKRGDRLADALGYAAHRLAVDNAILNNLPVETAEVGDVLAADPTLDEHLRLAYARHLLNLSLAMEDMTHAAPVGLLLRQHDDLSRETQALLARAVDEGRARMVYEALCNWLANPLGPHSEEWSRLAQRAAVQHMETLARGSDVEAVTAFLETVHETHPGVEIVNAVPRLIEVALPLSGGHRPLAETIFLLAVNYLDTDMVQRLLKSKKFVAQLPPAVGRLAPYLDNSDPTPTPPGMLAEVASAFGENWRPLVLLRFVEGALLSGRADLVDTSALAGLAQVALSPWGAQYERTLLWIVENMSRDEVLPALEDPGPRYLLQILLALGAYGELAAEMLHQSRLLYPGDHQPRYVQMVQTLFKETLISTEEVPRALELIQKAGIRSLPLAMAYIGVLEGHEWAEVLDDVADQVTTHIFDNPNILKVIHPGALLSLLRFHIKRRDVPNTARVASLFPDAAIERGGSGITMMVRLYKALNWDKELRIASMELLRRFIRQSSYNMGRRALITFGRELGDEVREALEATYIFKRLLGGVDFLDYAAFLHTTAELLHDTALAYSDRGSLPSLGALVNAMQSLSGSLTSEDRESIMREILGMSRAILALGDQQRAKSPRDHDRHIERLLTGRADPKSALDVLRLMGGYFAKGKRYQTRLSRATHHPLGERSAPMVRDETEIASHLLRSLLQSFPPDKDVRMKARAILGELDSLWGGIPLEQQREAVRGLAIDLQRLPDLVLHIAANGDARALENSGLGRRLDSGKQQPKSTLEFYRYTYGYFKALSSR
jgi:hypothetical protein